ncbi:MAG: hypothetical protein IH606_11055 [Burkholderiales bacterium]|nr:hypothetical protein [Burkholderiales bacterium]
MSSGDGRTMQEIEQALCNRVEPKDRGRGGGVGGIEGEQIWLDFHQ